MLRNQCQLITYPNSLGGSLRDLGEVLEEHFPRAFGGVHVLPFFPSSADRGFAPLTYREVDPTVGTWEDVARLAESYDLIVDFMLNHISRQSEYFQDFLRNKDDSPYADFFIRYSRFWPGGAPTDEQLRKIYTRKPRPPYLEISFPDGSTEKVWCTFDYEQIDLDMSSPAVLRFVREQLRWLCERGTKMIRLDAFAYATKKVGTNCFFVEPEVWELLAFAADAVAPYGVELLPEVHEHHTIQQKISEHNYWVYDFALPMLVLQAIFDGDAGNLRRWLESCPRKQVTTLDTHDGIGVVDVRDLMSDDDVERTQENLYQQGANVKRIYNTPQYGNLDVYQINCTYYSALGNDDAAYLLARAIQLFAPGIPQIYYVGLLTGRNDLALVEATKVGRNINRHDYTRQEIDEEVRRPVVQELLRLMTFRNEYPAFNGELSIEGHGEAELQLTWRKDGAAATLRADLAGRSYEIRYRDAENGRWVSL